MSLALALIGVVMMAGSLSLVDIVNAQGDVWYVVPQFVGFLIFTVAGFAETNRPPFDLPEADAELVAGYNTEFGGMRFGSFFMAEYINMIVISGLAAAMFLGGWMGPGPGFLDPLWMVAEDVRRRLLLHLDAGDAAAPALRPADELRLEGAAAARDAQPARDRDRRGADDVMEADVQRERVDWKLPVARRRRRRRGPARPRARAASAASTARSARRCAG